MFTKVFMTHFAYMHAYLTPNKFPKLLPKTVFFEETQRNYTINIICLALYSGLSNRSDNIIDKSLPRFIKKCQNVCLLETFDEEYGCPIWHFQDILTSQKTITGTLCNKNSNIFRIDLSYLISLISILI